MYTYLNVQNMSYFVFLKVVIKNKCLQISSRALLIEWDLNVLGFILSYYFVGVFFYTFSVRFLFDSLGEISIFINHYQVFHVVFKLSAFFVKHTTTINTK